MRSKTWMASIVIAAVVVAPIVSRANHVGYDTAEQCMQSGSVMTGLPTCTKFGDRWHASHPRAAPSPGGLFATFFFIWVILVGVSMWWVAVTAKKHGDPLGTALLGAFIGGPIFVLLYVSNSDIVRRARKVYRLTDQIPDAPSKAPVHTPSSPKAGRLRELTKLRDDGLITDDEYADKRRAIIDEL